LAQVLRGAVALGMECRSALRLAIRCARDSMPPLRLAILDDIAAHPDSLTKDVRKRLGKPRATVDRQLQSLHMLGVLRCDEEERESFGKPVTLWRYRLADDISADVLDPNTVPDLLPTSVLELKKRDRETEIDILPSHISGTVGQRLAQSEQGSQTAAPTVSAKPFVFDHDPIGREAA
jgi:hypothetical protein